MYSISALKFVLVLCIALAVGVIMLLFYPQMPTVYVFNGVYRNASFDFTNPIQPRGSVLVQVRWLPYLIRSVPLTLAASSTWCSP